MVDDSGDLRLLFTTGVWERLVSVDSAGSRQLVTRIPLPVGDDSTVSAQDVLAVLLPFQDVRSRALPELLEVRVSPGKGVELSHAMPFGGTLDELVAQSGPLRPPLVGALAFQLASALDALHDAGLVHGSLALDRVLFSRDCELTLLDAALVSGCRAMHVDLRFPDFRWEHVHPHAAFTAPELIGGGMSPSASADVFALAVLIAHLLIGRTPFNGSTALAVHTAIQRGRNTLDSDLGGILDASGVGALSVGMSPDPAARPGRASELVSAVFGSVEDLPDLSMAAAYCGRHLSAWNHDARLAPLDEEQSPLQGMRTSSRRDRLYAATITLENARRSTSASFSKGRPWMARAVAGVVAALVMLSYLLAR